MLLSEPPKFEQEKAALEITNQFYEILTNESSYVSKRILIVPQNVVDRTPEIQQVLQATGLKIASINDELTNMQEVVISDGVMKQMFLECFSALYLNHSPEESTIANLVILFITPADTTAVQRVWKHIIRQKDEKGLLTILFLLGGFLSCNYDKTNKSSSLWTLFKKLLLKIKKTGFKYSAETKMPKTILEWENKYSKDQLLNYAINVSLRSVREHPRNYYASGALRFFISRCDSDYLDALCLNLLDEIIAMEFDLSLWKGICDIIMDPTMKSLCYSDDETTRYYGGKVLHKKNPQVIDTLIKKVLLYGSVELINYIMLYKNVRMFILDKLQSINVTDKRLEAIKKGLLENHD